jgi:hypothetical protein
MIRGLHVQRANLVEVFESMEVSQWHKVKGALAVRGIIDDAPLRLDI